MKSLKDNLAGLSKNKLIRATVLEVLGNRVTVRLVGNGKKLFGIPFVGGPVSVGKVVYVNYGSGSPVAECRGESTSFQASAPSSQRPVVRTEFPQSEIGGATNEGTVALHSPTHAEGGTDELKLDDLGTPDDNTDLNATISAHGLLPKLGGGTTNFLRADGTWSAPAGGTGGHTIEEETTPLTARTKLSFQGSGVTVTDDGGNDRTIVTIPGGGGSPFDDEIQILGVLDGSTHIRMTSDANRDAFIYFEEDVVEKGYLYHDATENAMFLETRETGDVGRIILVGEQAIEFWDSGAWAAIARFLPAGTLQVLESAEPTTPAANWGSIYANAGKLYFKSAAGTVYDLTETGGGGGDAADITYTPAVATDWNSDTDPGNVDDALDQLAARVDDVEGVVSDAADVTYTPTTATDWNGDADPGNVDGALDQLAARVDDIETNPPSTDAADVTYTPTTLTDWDTDADPGDVDGALDQLAARVDDLEGAGGGGDAADITYTPTTAADWTDSADPGNVDDALDQLAGRLKDVEGGGGDAILSLTAGDSASQSQAGGGGNDSGYNYVDAVVLPHHFFSITSVKITPGTTCNLKLVIKDHATASTLVETGYEAVTSGVEKTFTLSTALLVTPYRYYRIGVQRDSGNWSAPYKNQVSDGGLFYFAGGYFGSTYYGGNPLNVTMTGVPYYGALGTGGGGGGGGASDAADLTYTPAVLTDWNGDADPGNADDALDQLAARVDDIETTGAASAFTDLTDVPGSYTGEANKIVGVASDETGLEFVGIINAGTSYTKGEADITTGLGGNMSASTEYSGYPASRLVDDNNATDWSSSTASVPQWVKIDLVTAKRVYSYTIRGDATGQYDITEWTLQGSNNETDWTNLDFRTGYSWSAGQQREFTLADPAGSYRYYRLYISGYGLFPQFAEWELFEAVEGTAKGIFRNVESSNIVLRSILSSDSSIELDDTGDSIDFVVSADNGAVGDLKDIHIDSGEPTGFPVRTSSTISFNDGTREFTLSPVTGNYTIYSAGQAYIKTAASVTIPNTPGLHYIYFDSDTLVLSTSMTAWDISSTDVPVACVYWNGSAGILMDERHGIQMDGMTHEWIHETKGAAFASGMAGTFAANGSSTTIGTGEWYDDDIEYVTTEQTQCRVFWLNGTTWNWTAAQAGYFYPVSSVPQYNNAGALADVDVNRYSHSWVYMTNHTSTPVVVIMGQAQYNSQALAEAAGLPNLGSFPSSEMLLLYKITWQRDGSVITWKRTDDYRRVAGGPIANYIATDHGALAGLTDPDHPATAVSTDPDDFSGIINTATNVNLALISLDTHVHDASATTYTPADTSKWIGNTDPGATDDALDQLASRINAVEGVSTHGADEIGYDPAVLADWDSSTDPGNADDALDQLAERVTDLEGAGGGGHTIEEETTPLTARSKLSFQGAGVTVTDDSGNDRTVVTIPLGTSPDLTAIFTQDLGILATVTGAIRIYNNTGTTKTINKVFLSVSTAPTGAAIIVDIHKNGTTIFTNQANRPQISAGANTGYSTTMAVTEWADGEYLTMDVDQVGSTVAGSYLAVNVVYSMGGYGQGTGGHTVEDETTARAQRTKLSFQGTGVTVTDDSGNDRTIVSIPGGLNFVDTPPASPSAENDEFDSSVLNAKWTVVTNTAANLDINTTWPSRIYANFTGNQAYQIKQSYAPGAAFSLTLKAHISTTTNYQAMEIYAYDNDESDGIRANIEGSTCNATLSHKTSTWTYNASTLAMPKLNTLYLHLQRGNSNDWSVWASTDGFTFTRVGTYSKTFTVDHFMIGVSSNGSSVPWRGGIDWIRRDWITL